MYKIIQGTIKQNMNLIIVSRGDLRWLNTVSQAVSSNSCDGECFYLHKQTWRRKSNGTQKTISQNLLIKIL